MHLFYGGFLSQWYPCKFTINGIEYNCAEQWMMAEKARLFKDNDTLMSIMTTSNPSTQKSLGKQVKGFDKEKWETVAREVVYLGNLAKFTQNHDLLELLYDTDEEELVEASPTDCIWGIGLAEHDPAALDKSQWRGTNWLGECIMRVRSDLKSRKH